MPTTGCFFRRGMVELETDMEIDTKYSHVLRDTSPMISPMMEEVSLET